MKCSVITTDNLLEALSREHCSVLSTITPTLALAGQEITGAEFSYDLVWDLYQKESFALITRGCKGAVASDQFFYYGLSPDYFTYPVFHTHPSINNEQGLYQPSKADQDHLEKLQQELGSRIPLVSLVLFPDRKYTLYGVHPTGKPFVEPGLDFTHEPAYCINTLFDLNNLLKMR